MGSSGIFKTLIFVNHKKNVLQLFSTCQSQKLLLENVYKKSKSFKHLSLKKRLFYMLQYVCQK